MSSEPPGEFWFHLIMNSLCGLWKVLFVLVLFNFWSLFHEIWKVLFVRVPFNSAFALWTPGGSVSSGCVLSSVCSTDSGRFCLFWFCLIQFVPQTLEGAVCSGSI